MAWAADFSAMQIKVIGTLELLGAIGIMAPMFIKKLQKLVPIAAIGLALVMVGAAVTHIGRGEPIIVNLVLLALCALTAFWRKDLLFSK